MQLGFGSGALWGVNNVSNPTPNRFGVLQDCSIDFSAKSVPIFGTDQLPVSVARGSITVAGKANLAQFNGRIIAELFFGLSTATGQVLVADSEVVAVASHIATVAHNSTWVTDLGVNNAATGVPFVRVSSLTAAGQYTVAAGVYTIYSSDSTASLLISYTYTASGGEKLSITNTPMGQANTFTTVLSLPYAGQDASFQLNACVANKMSFTTGLESFTKQDFEFGAFTDATNTLGTISVAEVA